jgi:glycosyltransferase involved in cell wall biosynthesis
VFALSSDTEQMPMSLLEAMGTGLPALVTDVGDCGPLLGTDGGAIVPRGDLAAYAAAIRDLAANPDRRAAAGRRNRRFAEQHHSLPKMVGEYRRVYERAAGRGPVPQAVSRTV